MELSMLDCQKSLNDGFEQLNRTIDFIENFKMNDLTVIKYRLKLIKHELKPAVAYINSKVERKSERLFEKIRKPVPAIEKELA
jgi:hypothetical protein